jgi:hypothetical protein
MLFTLDTATDAKLTSVTPRSEHHGTDLVSAITLGLTITGPNTILDLLSPTLRHALYTRADDDSQEALDGIEPPTPKLRTKHLGPLTLSIPAIEGGTLFVEWGIGDDMELGSCKVDKWRAECMEGGSVALSFRVSTSDLSEEEAGHLFGKLGQVIAIRFEPPAPKTEPVQTGQVIDGTKGPSAGPLFDDPEEDDDSEDGEPDATDTFVAQHAEAAADTLEERTERGEPAWPFPTGRQPTEGENPASGPRARSEQPAGLARKAARQVPRPGHGRDLERPRHEADVAARRAGTGQDAGGLPGGGSCSVTAPVAARARSLLQAWRAELHRSYVTPGTTSTYSDEDVARDIAELDEVIASLSEGTASLKAENKRLGAKYGALSILAAAVDAKYIAAAEENERLKETVRGWINENGPGGWINELRNENARLKAEHATLRAEFDAAGQRLAETCAQLAQTVAERDALAEQLRACERDAARYLWLRDEAWDCGVRITDGNNPYYDGRLDMLVDSYLSTTPGKEQA